MSFLITDAYAAATPAGSASEGGMSFPFLLIIFVIVFYFLLFRPQAKRAKEQRTLLGNLVKGDEVIIAGGIYGRIIDINENVVKLAIADNVEVKAQKSSIVATVPKGTLKQL